MWQNLSRAKIKKLWKEAKMTDETLKNASISNEETKVESTEETSLHLSNKKRARSYPM